VQSTCSTTTFSRENFQLIICLLFTNAQGMIYACAIKHTYKSVYVILEINFEHGTQASRVRHQTQEIYLIYQLESQNI